MIGSNKGLTKNSLVDFFLFPIETSMLNNERLNNKFMQIFTKFQYYDDKFLIMLKRKIKVII